ncbi:MAG: UvrD-helicase domain-containing protein, partial [Clostridiales bacterium]|nr:UvrD-helicase domain-containing protein [Clostridiales bacterium]
MPEKKWTKEQLDAISFRGGNLLVAAGAGSGKTSVLVERVLGLIGARAEAFGEGGSGDECGGESGGGSEHEGERGGESGGESESGGGGERESGGERGGESRGGSEHESGSERESENALARSGGAGPVGIDRLLIVTFTNAAAAEMKERLADALTGELEAAEAVLRRMGGGGDGGSGEDGDGGNGGGYGSFGGGRERGQARRQDGDRAGARRARARASHLRRQLILLGSASISTIHSFCLNVIKENIHLADGVDPNFRLLDDAEASLMKYDALIPVLEEKYAEPFNERFEMLAESFGDSRDDRGMAEAILAAHSFAQGFPWPGRWLAGMVEAAHIETEDDFDGSAWNAEIAARLAEGLSALLGALARNRGALLACIAKEEGVRAAENAIGALERMGAGLGLGDELGLGAGLGAGLGLGDGLGLGAKLGIGGQAPARPPKWRAVKEQLEILGDMQALCPRARRNEDGACKKAREAVKAATRAFLSDAAPFYRLEMRDILDEFKWMRAVLSELVDAVLKLDKRYGDEKRRRAALDFNDLEHLALKILIESGDDGGDGDDGGGENSEESWSGEYGRGSGDDGDGEGAMKGEAPASATAASAPGAHAAAMPWAPATRAARAAQSAQSSQGVAEPVAGASDASRISGISGISGAPAATFSAVAEAYRDRFAEVLVDEYQDSNLVQELIIQAVSKASNGGGAGGTFMVGDVKQSIYRFRQSMPELFMSKYTEYAPLGHPGDAGAAGEGRGGGGAGRGTLITLFKNFRSDPRLLDFINAVFSKIMSKKAGELDYTESEWLLPGAPRGSGGAGNAASDGAAGAAVEIHLLSKKPVAPGLGFALGAGDAGGAGNAGGPGESNGTDGSNEAGDPDGAGRSGGADGAGESSESGESGESGEFEDADAAESAQNAVHEARFVASRIAELMQTATVAGRDGSRRPLAYRDIAVLMRAVGGTAQPFADELANLGVPAYTEAGAGYFESYEIDIMLSVLKIIDNPLQDIPMFAVMLSPIFSFPPERAAKIKWDASNGAGRGGNDGNYGNDGGNGGNDSSGSISSNGGDGSDGPSSGGADSFSGGSASPPLFHCLKAAASAGDQKAEGALRQLGEWRRMAAEMPVSELIWHIMQSTGFYARARAMPGGAVRQANLRQLFEYARQYEQISYKGIFNFIRFVDKLAEQGGDVAGAKIIGESDDIVRIMSIHKSKGLEFPVVFLCGCGRKFNMLDASKHVLLHRRLGFGPNYVDLGRRVSDYSIPKRIIARAIRNEALSEEMRILYVAMT